MSNRFLRRLERVEAHEPEPLALSGLFIHVHLRTQNRPVRNEQRGQIGVHHLVREMVHEQIRAFRAFLERSAHLVRPRHHVEIPLLARRHLREVGRVQRVGRGNLA